MVSFAALFPSVLSAVLISHSPNFSLDLRHCQFAGAGSFGVFLHCPDFRWGRRDLPDEIVNVYRRFLVMPKGLSDEFTESTVFPFGHPLHLALDGRG
jgi:hypothetical protein